jgi:hypothetical protein
MTQDSPQHVFLVVVIIDPGYSAGIFSNNFQLLDAPTGTMTTGTAQNSDLNNLLGLVYNGDNLHIGQRWKELYREIAQDNQVLDKVPGINPMDEEQKKRVLGGAFSPCLGLFLCCKVVGGCSIDNNTTNTVIRGFLALSAQKQKMFTIQLCRI